MLSSSDHFTSNNLVHFLRFIVISNDWTFYFVAIISKSIKIDFYLQKKKVFILPDWMRLPSISVKRLAVSKKQMTCKNNPKQKW